MFPVSLLTLFSTLFLSPSRCLSFAGGRPCCGEFTVNMTRQLLIHIKTVDGEETLVI